MIKVMFFFSIFFVVILQYFYVNSLTQQFKLCHPQFTQSEYYIPPPHPCVRHQQETIHKCSAKIFNPSDTLIQVPVQVPLNDSDFRCKYYKCNISISFGRVIFQNEFFLFLFIVRRRPPQLVSF